MVSHKRFTNFFRHTLVIPSNLKIDLEAPKASGKLAKKLRAEICRGLRSLFWSFEYATLRA